VLQLLQSNLPESEVISLCRPSLLSKLGTHFQAGLCFTDVWQPHSVAGGPYVSVLTITLTLQLCSQGGSQQVQNLFCLDEVTKIEKSFVLEIFETISPNSSGALHDAHELNPKDFAKHVNNMCTGNNGPEPYITPVVPPKMSHDVPKVLGNFVEFQALYLWELGRMIEVRLVQQALSAIYIYMSAAADCSHHNDNTVTFAIVGRFYYLPSHSAKQQHNVRPTGDQQIAFASRMCISLLELIVPW